jgi:hypothetical protein
MLQHAMDQRSMRPGSLGRIVTVLTKLFNVVVAMQAVQKTLHAQQSDVAAGCDVVSSAFRVLREYSPPRTVHPMTRLPR